MCMKVKLQQTKWVLVNGSSGAQGSWQAINSCRPLNLTRRTMKGSVTDWYAPLHRRDIARYAGQVLSRERFFRYGQCNASFAYQAAVPLQLDIVLRPRRVSRQGNGLCMFSVRKGVGAH